MNKDIQKEHLEDLIEEVSNLSVDDQLVFVMNVEFTAESWFKIYETLRKPLGYGGER